MLKVVLDIWSQKTQTVRQAGNSLVVPLTQSLKVSLALAQGLQAHDTQVDTLNVRGQNSKILWNHRKCLFQEKHLPIINYKYSS